MSSDHDAEIRASVAAHQDLGSAYDDALAEGLVERIGAEIDKRIDARLGQSGPNQGSVPPPGPGAAPPGSAAPAGAAGAAGAAAPPGAAPLGYPGYQAPPGYQGYPHYQGYMGPMLPPGYQMGPPPLKPSTVSQRNVAITVTALGSMSLGVLATAIVSRASHPAAQAIMVLLVWTAITVINIAYARRR